MSRKRKHVSLNWADKVLIKTEKGFSVCTRIILWASVILLVLIAYGIDYFARYPYRIIDNLDCPKTDYSIPLRNITAILPGYPPNLTRTYSACEVVMRPSISRQFDFDEYIEYMDECTLSKVLRTAGTHDSYFIDSDILPMFNRYLGLGIKSLREHHRPLPELLEDGNTGIELDLNGDDGRPYTV